MAVVEPDEGATAEAAPKAKIGEAADVTMHPLVLLSTADHYHRVAKGTRKRVVGVLLGQVVKGKVDASNSFAVPFEEDSRNPVSSPNTTVFRNTFHDQPPF
jgi:26S proteasome regulatory subunit N8